MGGRSGLTDAFLAAIFGIIGMVAAAYTVQATLRLCQEESSGRVEALLATGVGRLRWATSHLTVALLGTALLPATWVLAGFGTALIGLAPRLSALAWAALILSVLLVELGALFGLKQWIIDVAPFAHLPKLPGSPFTVTPVLWLTVIAIVLGAAGLTGLRRRDMPVT
jgi:ABC-2 type transport system permease protein